MGKSGECGDHTTELPRQIQLRANNILRRPLTDAVICGGTPSSQVLKN